MKIFEYTNTSGEKFAVKFSSKEEKAKAWLKMFKYYDSDDRLHPLSEFLDLDNKEIVKLYEKAKQKNVSAIKKLLNIMWDKAFMPSFYGEEITVD